MCTSIFDPSIPYIGPISGTKFSPGKLVRIQGLAPGIGYRFNINLQCGPETAPQDDVAIQISVRLLDGYISLNSLQHGIWGEEQRGALQVKRTEKFEIIIMCDFYNQYKVAINGQHYCEFPQRIHHDHITHLAIDGDVSIFQISYESNVESDARVSSRNGVPSASAPLRTPSGDNERDDFEMIDATTSRPRQPQIRPPPSPGFSQPPSYDAAIRPPYPISGPVGMPHPTQNPVGTPYPTQGAVGMPYPTSPTTTSQYPPGGTTIGVSAPVGAPTPLNAPTSSYHPVIKRNSGLKCWASICSVILGIIIVIGVVVGSVTRYSSTLQYSNSYSSDHGSSYGNN